MVNDLSDLVINFNPDGYPPTQVMGSQVRYVVLSMRTPPQITRSDRSAVFGPIRHEPDPLFLGSARSGSHGRRLPRAQVILCPRLRLL